MKAVLASTTAGEHRSRASTVITDKALTRVLQVMLDNLGYLQSFRIESSAARVIEFSLRATIAHEVKIQTREQVGTVDLPLDRRCASLAAMKQASQACADAMIAKVDRQKDIAPGVYKSIEAGQYSCEQTIGQQSNAFCVTSPCEPCHGAGAQTCPTCGGAKRLACRAEEMCFSCTGRGVVEHMEWQQSPYGPSGQMVTKQRGCWNCGGSDNYAGRGVVPCSRCQGQGFIACAACRQSGIRACPSCKGTKWKSSVSDIAILARVSVEPVMNAVPEEWNDCLELLPRAMKTRGWAYVDDAPILESGWSFSFRAHLPVGRVQVAINESIHQIEALGLEEPIVRSVTLLPSITSGAVDRLKGLARRAVVTASLLKPLTRTRVVRDAFATNLTGSHDHESVRDRDFASDEWFAEFTSQVERCRVRLWRFLGLRSALQALSLNALMAGGYYAFDPAADLLASARRFGMTAANLAEMIPPIAGVFLATTTYLVMFSVRRRSVIRLLLDREPPRGKRTGTRRRTTPAPPWPFLLGVVLASAGTWVLLHPAMVERLATYWRG